MSSPTRWLTLLIVGSPCLARADDDWLARFNREAPAAWAVLIEKWSPAWVEVDEQCSGTWENGTTWRFAYERVVKVADQRKILISTNRENTQAPNEAGRSLVSCVNNGKEFSLNRKESLPWVVRSLGTETKAMRDALDTTEALQVCAALSLFNRPIYRILENGSFAAERAEPSSSEGRPAVRVYFTFKPQPNERTNLRGGWVDFLPDLCWVIGGFHTQNRAVLEPLDGPASFMIDGSHYYRPGSRGADVVIARVEQTNAGPGRDGKEIRSHCEWIYKKFDLQAAPSSDFEPAAFGLNLSLEPESVSPLRRGVFWLTMAAVLALAAAWLHRKARAVA